MKSIFERYIQILILQFAYKHIEKHNNAVYICWAIDKCWLRRLFPHLAENLKDWIHQQIYPYGTLDDWYYCMYDLTISKRYHRQLYILHLIKQLEDEIGETITSLRNKTSARFRLLLRHFTWRNQQ